MVVQHNLTAMNANRMLGITTGQQAKSSEKLSSGYKINRAADDAAGLSISEKMRKQINGLERASTNAQDGVSSVQTAEGALAEVHSMLQRMNELSVQAANGTNSVDDRDAIQAEIEQLTTEIDRVAETTKFNETYLLKGQEGTKDIYMVAHDAGLAGDLNTTLKTASFATDIEIGDIVTIGGKQYTIGVELDDAKAMIKASADADTKIAYSIDGRNFLVNNDTVFNEDGEKLYVRTPDGTTGGAAAFSTTAMLTTEAKYKTDVALADPDANNTAVAVTDLQNYLEDSSTFTVGTKEYKVTSDADDTVITIEDAYVKMKEELEAANSIGTDEAVVVTNNEDGTFTWELGATKVPNTLSFNLHVGTDADMTNKINVDIEAMTAAGLGIKGLNVSDDSGMAATYAIDAIGDALQKVSSQRSSLGAIQNRLEHTIANLDNVVENTTAAESRIRDTDMAEEMVEYSKNNILAQAGQSMLAQANQSTQGVLSLLQ